MDWYDPTNMPNAPIPESPSARVLLELAATAADARLVVGGRPVLVRTGSVTEIGALPGDLSFGDFLLAAERIAPRDLAAVVECAEERSIGLEQALRELDAVSEEVLFTTRRALLVDRLMRGFAEEELHQGERPEPTPLDELALGSGYPTLELVLDALARRAAHGEAELLGRLPSARFVWLEGPERTSAAEWADLGDIPIATSLSTLFPRHPAAPTRIVALLRAGLAKLDVSDELAARVPLLASEEAKRASPPLEAAATSAAPTSAPAAREDTPVLAVEGPLAIVPVANWLATSEQSLHDPLAAPEARAHELDADGASPAERAAAWLKLADSWLTHLHSFGEAARAAREAAAADPSHVQALAEAATYTGAAGAPEIALAYALAWASLAEPGESRARALLRAAEYAERAGLADQALAARRSAQQSLPADPGLTEQLAFALAAAGDTQAAVELARKAAEQLRDHAPERARAMLEWSVRLAPANVRSWTDLARVLARSAKGAAAVATLATAARVQRDSALRERLRTSAVTFAEAGTRLELAAEVLLEALDAQSVDRERLVGNLYAAGDWNTLAVIAAELAADSSGAARATFLIHAAEASLARDEPERALSLLKDAVVSDPEHAEALDRLRELATRTAHPFAVRDALERAVRERCPQGAAASLTPAARAEVGALLDRLLLEFTSAEDGPQARWAAELFYELDGRTLDLQTARDHEQRLANYAAELERREQAVRAASGHGRTEPALALAALLRRDPARRAAARKLYRKLLESDPSQAGAFRELAALLWLDGDLAALRDLHEHASERDASVSSLLALAHLEIEARETERALDATFRAIAKDPRHIEALTLAWRLAQARADAARSQSALRMLADALPSGEAKARVSMRLARLELANGLREQAVQSARAALLQDGESAEAALFVLMHNEHLPPKQRAAALVSARYAFGDSATLLRELARASFGAGYARVQRDALETLLQVAPRDAFAARALIALHTTGRDGELLAEALDAALSSDRFEPETLYVAQRGLIRLNELGQAKRAVAIVVSALPVLGERALPLLPWAEQTAIAAGARELACAVLEQRVALSEPESRAARLRELAARYREADLLWAEARAYLRLLAIEPEDEQALRALAAIYARTSEATRLRGVLEALYDQAQSEESKRERLFELALCALHFESDPERATELVKQAVAPRREGRELHEAPRDALRRGLGLLRAAAPQRAFVLLRELAGESSHERARELLEEALALAESDLRDPTLALDAAMQGVLSYPDHEPFAAALDRQARALSRFESWLDTLETAAARTANPERQAALLIRAADIAERELGDGARACVLLDRAYQASPSDAVEELALAAARALFVRDLRAGKLAYDRLRDTLHVRAKFGSPLSRAHALITLSRLADEVYLTREDAVRYADAAHAALALADDADPSERARVQAFVEQRSAQIAATEPARAPSRTSGALRRSVLDSETPQRALLQAAPTFRPGGSLPAEPRGRSLLPTLEPLASLPPVEIRGQGLAVTAIPAASDETSSVHDLEPAAVTLDSIDALAVAVASGQTSALTAIAHRIEGDRDSAAALCRALLAQVRGRPVQVCALRGLRLASAAANEHALWRTSSQALAFVEPQLRPPAASRRRDHRGARAEAALEGARESAHGRAFELLAKLVEAAAPLFRRKLEVVLGRSQAPEPLREAPFSQLLTELSSLFGARHDAYAVSSGEDRVSLVSVQPASILIGDRTPRDASALRFRLARAFEAARPEHVLLATLAPSDGEALFAALRAAFGPAEAQRAHTSKQAAAIAADLWRTMPSGAQRKLTALLAELDVPLAFDRLHEDLRLRSARMALYVTRELDVALAQLGRDLDAGAVPLERSEGAFNRALASDPLTRELIVYALSDAYLRSLSDEA